MEKTRNTNYKQSSTTRHTDLSKIKVTQGRRMSKPQSYGMGASCYGKSWQGHVS